MSCPDCFSGHVHEGQPRGKTIKLHNLDAYVTEPTNNGPVRGIIVIVPDAFGWEFVNNRILADHYTDKGNYKVYLPDFMLGQQIHRGSSSALKPTSANPRYRPLSAIMATRHHA